MSTIGPIRGLGWLLVWQEIALLHVLGTRGLLALPERDRAAVRRRLLRGTLAEIDSLHRPHGSGPLSSPGAPIRVNSGAARV